MGPKRISELSKSLEVDYSIIYSYIDELVKLGIIIKDGDLFHIFNRTFASWILARKELPEIARVEPTEQTLISKLREFERRVALAEKIASYSFETMAQILIGTILGQTVDAKKLGATRLSKVKVPEKIKFNINKRILGKMYELDALLEDKEKWGVEITISKIDAKYILETIDVWNLDVYWFISYKGFTRSAMKLLEKHGNIILTNANQLEALLKETILREQY